MDRQEYHDLQISPLPRTRIPLRALWVVGFLVGLRLLWVIAPSQVLFWLLLPVLALITWAASFGWRSALRALRIWLDRVAGE